MGKLSRSSTSLSRRVTRGLGMEICYKKSMVEVVLTCRTKDRENIANLRTMSKPKENKDNENSKKDTRKWREFQKIPWNNIDDFHLQ